MKKFLALVPAIFVAACATTTPGIPQYARVHDGKTNTVHYAGNASDTSSAFVGTAAIQPANGRSPGTHP